MYGLAGDQDFALVGPIQSADQVEQGRLAGPGRSHQGDELTGHDLKVDPVQHLDQIPLTSITLCRLTHSDQAFPRGEGAHGRLRVVNVLTRPPSLS